MLVKKQEPGEVSPLGLCARTPSARLEAPGLPLLSLASSPRPGRRPSDSSQVGNLSVKTPATSRHSASTTHALWVPGSQEGPREDFPG